MGGWAPSNSGGGGGVTADVIIIGTENGTPTGVQRVFVNNLRSQVLAAHDLQRALVWSDFGTKNERIATITYTSATFPSVTVTKTFNYTHVGNAYRLDSVVWSVA